MKNLDILKNFIENSLHINVDDDTLNKFNIYYDLLLEWNEKFNLTTILEENDVLYKHFIDSLSVMNFVDFSNKRLLDIGSGAGFPALPLAILNKQLKIDLYESNAKKVSFLNEVKNKLSLDNVSIFNKRAEENKNREYYDFASARAVVELNILLELTIPFLKVNGALLAYKKYDVEEEIARAKSSLKILDCSLESVNKFVLPNNIDKRAILLIKKNKKSKNKYPRNYSLIVKNPL